MIGKTDHTRPKNFSGCYGLFCSSDVVVAIDPSIERESDVDTQSVPENPYLTSEEANDVVFGKIEAS